MSNATTGANPVQAGAEAPDSTSGAHPEYRWLHAPNVVRHWAIPLALIGPAFLSFAISWYFAKHEASVGLFTVLAGATGMAVGLWQRKALQRADPRAWNLQILLSIVGLLAIPVGTLAYGFLLTQWFKPETKAWFRPR